MSDFEPIEFDDCPTHAGIECEKPCPCTCEECDQDGDLEGE